MGGSALRWVFLGLSALLFALFLPKLFGEGEKAHQRLHPEHWVVQPERKPEEHCDLWSPEFHARVGTHGAALTSYVLLTAKYQHGGQGMQLATAPAAESRRQLRFHLRNEAVAEANDPSWQVPFDALEWTLERADGKSCTLTYSGAGAHITRTLATTGRPYEIEVTTRVENRAPGPRRHAMTVETADWRTTRETAGGMFQVSPFVTHVECARKGDKTVRLGTHDFEPTDFEAPEFARTALNVGEWYQPSGDTAYAAVTNAYFASALVPLRAPDAAACQLQIEERFDPRLGRSDPNAGAMYRARLAWPARELAPGASAEYSVLAYIGPKERAVLAAAGGGHAHLDDLIDLGFFSAIAKVLVGFLLFVHGKVGNWGVAIILLTLVAKVLLFPLAIPMIKSQVRMRELKPEMDALNEKFKDDAQARGLAQMELWRKHNVNPFKGCLPQLASMPVWFALYTTLQTAVELYNIPFLWFPDLSQPDPFYVLPLVIGATNFVQQKMMPMTGGDPAQQKMMLYVMPTMFTVFMLFLPAGLGVYMFTNGVLSIVQQQMVEWHVRRSTGIRADGSRTGDAGAGKAGEPKAGDEGKKGAAGKKAGAAG